MTTTTPTFPAVIFSVTDAGIAELEAKHRDHDTRRAAAVQQAQALADEVARLNEFLNRPIRVCEACAIYPCRCE